MCRLRKNIITSLIFIIAILSAIAFSKPANAGGAGSFIDAGEGGPSGPTTGGGSANCSTYPYYTYILDCVGTSWITYDFLPSSGLEGQEGWWKPFGNRIDPECAHEGRTLYHFGQNAAAVKAGTPPTAYDNTWFADPEDSLGAWEVGWFSGPTPTYTYRTSGNGHTNEHWGHFITYNRGKTSSGVDSFPGPLLHELMKNGVAMYSATAYVNDSDAWEKYKVAFKTKHGREPSSWSDEGGVSMFCYWPGMDDKGETATFNGSIEGRINGAPGSSITINEGESVNISFVANVGRDNNPEEYTGRLSTKYWGTGNAGRTNVTDTPALAKNRYMGQTQLGYTIDIDAAGTYCETLHYYSSIDIDAEGNPGDPYNEVTKQACVTVRTTPPPPSGNCNPVVKIEGKVGSKSFNADSDGTNTGNTPTNPYVINDPKQKISFKHSITTGSFNCKEQSTTGNYYRYSHDSSASMTWSTKNIKNVDSAGRTTSPIDPRSSGSPKVHSNTKTVSANTTYTLVDHSNEYWTEQWNNGEIKTFCQDLEASYNWKIHFDASRYYYYGWHYYNHQNPTLTRSKSTSLCFSVKYENNDPTPPTPENPSSKKCNLFEDADSEYTVFSGKNVGGVRATRNIAGSRKKSEKVTNNSKVTVWTRPDDTATFEESMCEGAELSVQYWAEVNANLKKEISYKVEDFITSKTNRNTRNSASKTYFNSSLASKSEWKNTSPEIRNLSSARAYTDIFGNSGDAKKAYKRYEASSSKTTGYTITNDEHVGRCIGHTLKWTSLTTSNGGYNRAPSVSGPTNIESIGEACTPFNYDTTISVKRDSTSPYVYPGATNISTSVTVNFNGRTNPIVDSTAYRTKTKPTTIKFISFVISNEVPSSSAVKTSNELYAGNASTDLAGSCTGFISVPYGSAYGPHFCHEYGSQGPTTYPASQGSTTYSKSFSVPDDIPIGSKYCVVTAVYPSDSHNKSGQNLANDAGIQDAALTENGSYWRISKPTCVTIGKRPTTQVIGSGLYVEGEVATSNSKRTGIQRTYSSDLYKQRVFGSWSEYEIVAKGTINGMASGASFWNGYRNTASARRSVTNKCFFSSLTLTNSNCSSGTLGGFNTDEISKVSNSAPASIVQHLRDRYVDSSKPRKATSTLISSSRGCKYNDRYSKYLPFVESGWSWWGSGSETYDTTNSGTYGFFCLENGTMYVPISGSTKLVDSVNTHVIVVKVADKMRNNTRVFDVQDTFTINSDLLVADGINADGTPQDTVYNGINEVPRTIIFAKKINITGNVKQIDAWLIADEINTCSDMNVANGPVTNCDNQLHINGAVYAKKLYLNRTYGGGGHESLKKGGGGWFGGGGSITPAALSGTDGVYQNSQAAEVFTLRPDDIMWAYSQSERYMQATTTYQRELPVRY